MTNQLMYVLLQFTWGILQNLAGLAMFLACKMLGCKSKKYKNAVATKWNNKYGSVSLGMFLFVTDDEDETLVAHEYGHSLQSLFLGPLFFFVIGIPSICWNGRRIFLSAFETVLPQIAKFVRSKFCIAHKTKANDMTIVLPERTAPSQIKTPSSL